MAEHLADEEISIGNYVLSGGELAAAVVVDTVARLLPGVLGNEASSAFESFQDTGHGEGLLDCPHWTRPAEFRGWKAPDVLLGGNHEENPQIPPEDRAGEDGEAAAGFALKARFELGLTPPGVASLRSACCCATTGSPARLFPSSPPPPL